ncbi:MAG: hypothetical protein E6772_07515 [Dysgonomonas sp.]|nr:hypothetical protein [Dysgonomonas sp.]
MKRSILLSVMIVSFVTGSLKAQVTIGSGSAPQAGALLELKESEGNDDNSRKGLLFPRVALTKNDELYPMFNIGDTEYENNKSTIKKSHVGLTVYNTTSNSIKTPVLDIFDPGIYAWNGENWLRMERTLVTEASVPVIQDLKCASASLNPNTYTQGVAYNGVLTVPYTGGNGAPYNEGVPVKVNGLTLTLQGGTLGNGGGSLYYTVTGVPEVSAPTPIDFPIKFFDLDCTVSIAGNTEIKTMEYMKAIISPLPIAPEPGYNGGASEVFSEPVTMGNLSIMYMNWKHNTLGFGGAGEEIVFSSKKENHVTFLYSKSGSGGTNFAYYGQAALTANEVFYFKNAENSSGGGGQAYNLNSWNRDYAVLLITFHNTREIYRVSFNIHGSIPAKGSVPGADSSLTVFIERLE